MTVIEPALLACGIGEIASVRLVYGRQARHAVLVVRPAGAQAEELPAPTKGVATMVWSAYDDIRLPLPRLKSADEAFQAILDYAWRCGAWDLAQHTDSTQIVWLTKPLRGGSPYRGRGAPPDITLDDGNGRRGPAPSRIMAIAPVCAYRLGRCARKVA